MDNNNNLNVPSDNPAEEAEEQVFFDRRASALSAKLPAEFVGNTGQGQCSIPVPVKISPENSLDEILVFARSKKATDVHITTDNTIYFRLGGVLRPQTDTRLTTAETEKILQRAFTPKQFENFKLRKDIEFVHVIEGAGRFRVTIVKKSFGWDIIVRLIPINLYSFEESGMPEQCRGLTDWAQGMVLVTGPIGCGKTTTLSVLCEMINQKRSDHIITIENPIEFVFTPKGCQITQREINMHTLSQDAALRAALRQDPDIIVISELRDTAMIQLAATAAETGHLVLGTMNTNDAAQTILRLVNSFPSADRTLVQNMIAESLRGVICQQLVPKKDGSGVVPAYELLLINSAVANLIRKGSIEQIERVISTGSNEGMTTMDKSLMKLLKSGTISWDEAYKRSVNKRDLESLRYMRLT